MNELVPLAHRPAPTICDEIPMPACVAGAGPAAAFVWDEFFGGVLQNANTRRAYSKAVTDFFRWIEPDRVQIHEISPGLVGRYIREHPGSIPTRKLALAALRALFDLLVQRHVVILNPAASVRGEKYRAVEGKTPEIGVEQARRLLASIDTNGVVGKRDRAAIAILMYTAARVGAVARLKSRDFWFDGEQWLLRFDREKGGQSREIPVRHDLQRFIIDYLEAAGSSFPSKDAALLQSAAGRTGTLTGRPLSSVDIYRMVKRRLREAGLPARFSPHSFRVTTITDLLTQGVPLEDVQYLVGHSDPRTTRLYDRRQKKVSRNIVERISI